jgi:hypothetical protein
MRRASPALAVLAGNHVFCLIACHLRYGSR